MGENNFQEFYKEALEYIGKGDAVQGSEKLYKSGEVAIKEVSKYFCLGEYEEAEKNGKWSRNLLFSAVRNLSKKAKKDFIGWWHSAWVLHTEGFHEMGLDIEEVKVGSERIKDMLKVVEDILNRR